MSLCITRKLAQTFTIAWPTGHTKAIECIDVAGRRALVDGKVRTLPAILFAPDSCEACHIAAEQYRNGFNQSIFKIDAPMSVQVVRDNAIRREKAV